MDTDALGAPEVRGNEIPVTPTAPNSPYVLAITALRVDRVVSVSASAEDLWGKSPPRSTNLQPCILQLRESISPPPASGAVGVNCRTAKGILVTSPRDHRLNSYGGSGDVRKFERLPIRAWGAPGTVRAGEPLRRVG